MNDKTKNLIKKILSNAGIGAIAIGFFIIYLQNIFTWFIWIFSGNCSNSNNIYDYI